MPQTSRTDPSRTPGRTRRAGVAVAVAVGIAVLTGLLAACDGGGSPGQSPSVSSASPSTSSASPSGDACATPTRSAGIYYAADVPDFGPRLYREFARVATCQDPITESLTHMFQVAPVDPDYTSLWSSSTEVLSVATSGSTATVDVSEFPALGASFESAAVQQLVWTATAADKSVKKVRLLVDGRTPESGHVDWSAPVARGNALETLANVWILAPTQGATVSSPVKVRVYGTGWEGNVPIRVFQGDKEVAATYVTTMQGEFAEASTTIKLPAGQYVIHAYNDNGEDDSLDLWDTKAFAVG